MLARNRFKALLRKPTAEQFAQCIDFIRLVFVFGPAVSLFFLGVALLYFPSAARVMLALFLMFSGALLGGLTWLGVRLFRQVDSTLRAVDGRVALQGIIIRNPQMGNEQEIKTSDRDSDKDWMH